MTLRGLAAKASRLFASPAAEPAAAPAAARPAPAQDARKRAARKEAEFKAATRRTPAEGAPADGPRFDLALFRALNAEYASKKLVPKPPGYQATDLEDRGAKRAKAMARQYRVSGRVLEIGCGRGEVCRALAENHGCEVVGVDIEPYEQWETSSPGLTLMEADLSDSNLPDLGEFDFIYSNAVFEHVRNPYATLRAAYELLKPAGRMFLSTNLYRGPKASHRYREVYFPWPHLLFADEVFEDFYVSIGKPPRRPAWINQLSIADYYNYFDMIGFERLETSFSTTPIDEDFYRRFADKLERIPRFDLERDFLKVLLAKRR